VGILLNLSVSPFLAVYEAILIGYSFLHMDNVKDSNWGVAA
jgi:hypothetical protein